MAAYYRRLVRVLRPSTGVEFLSSDSLAHELTVDDRDDREFEDDY